MLKQGKRNNNSITWAEFNQVKSSEALDKGKTSSFSYVWNRIIMVHVCLRVHRKLNGWRTWSEDKHQVQNYALSTTYSAGSKEESTPRTNSITETHFKNSFHFFSFFFYIMAAEARHATNRSHHGQSGPSIPIGANKAHLSIRCPSSTRRTSISVWPRTLPFSRD